MHGYPDTPPTAAGLVPVQDHPGCADQPDCLHHGVLERLELCRFSAGQFCLLLLLLDLFVMYLDCCFIPAHVLLHVFVLKDRSVISLYEIIKFA